MFQFARDARGDRSRGFNATDGAGAGSLDKHGGTGVVAMLESAGAVTGAWGGNAGAGDGAGGVVKSTDTGFGTET